jgi:hypothetical protein
MIVKSASVFFFNFIKFCFGIRKMNFHLGALMEWGDFSFKLFSSLRRLYICSTMTLAASAFSFI